LSDVVHKGEITGKRILFRIISSSRIKREFNILMIEAMKPVMNLSMKFLTNQVGIINIKK
jgi:hypothetical protein